MQLLRNGRHFQEENDADISDERPALFHPSTAKDERVVFVI